MIYVTHSLDIIILYNIMSFSFFNSFNGNSQRLGQNYSIVSADVNPPRAVSSIGSDTSSVTFSFSAPTTGGTISGYTAYVNGKPFSGTGGPSSYTINGLSAGGQYTINMVANIVSTSSTSTTTMTAFAPTSITGSILWLDGADPNGTGTTPAINSSVTTWTDKSGSGNNATATSAAKYSNNGITFTSGNFYTMNVPYPETYTVFLVSTNSSSSQSYFFTRSAGPGNSPSFVQNYSGTTLEWYNNANRNTISSSPSSPFLATVSYQNGGNTTGYYFGTQSYSVTSTQTYTSSPWTGIGGSSATGNRFVGTMYELIFYNSVLSTTDRQKIEGYLAWKWGLQANLPLAHPYYSAAPPGASSTVTTTNTKNVLSNPSQPVVISTLAPFPTNIQLISATTSSLTFSFTAPTVGSTPTGYTPYINGSAGTGSGTPSSYTITGLSAGTSYSVAMGANVTTSGSTTTYQNPTPVSLSTSS